MKKTTLVSAVLATLFAATPAPASATVRSAQSTQATRSARRVRPEGDDRTNYLLAEWKRAEADAGIRDLVGTVLGKPPATVLDVGCGAGEDLIAFPGATRVGIDIDACGLRLGKSLYEARDETPPLLVRGAAESLPYRSSSFDAVVCRLALPYTDVSRALASLSRVVKPGGLLLVKVHAQRYYVKQARRAVVQGDPRALAHALRVLAAGWIYRITGWQPVIPSPRGGEPMREVFVEAEALERHLADLGLVARMRVDEEGGTPLVAAIRPC